MNLSRGTKQLSMTRIRLIIFLTTILVVGTIVTLVSLYARGYRFNPDKLKFNPNGIFVVKSVPDGAQVLLNGELETATNATIPLPPALYDVSIRKEGHLIWNKRLVIEKEVVTEVTAHLFKSTPSLSAVTFSGCLNPIPSRDISKIAFIVPSNPGDTVSLEDKAGLWIMETANLPVGFSREPRRITDGVLMNATWIWSPDGREILLSTEKGSFLLDAGKFIPQNLRVNVATTKDEIIADWESEQKTRLKSQLRRLPKELAEILSSKASSVVFSPDTEMVVYTTNSSTTIPPDLIKPVPGASTQKQERDIKKGQTYVYDIEEDRNFLIDDGSTNLIIEGGYTSESKRRLSWFPTSRHLVLAEENKITIMDYDGTNRQTVYSGSYQSPHAYPTLSMERIIVLTNLGAEDSVLNLYSLSLK